MLESVLEDCSLNRRLRAVGKGKAGEGWELLVAEDKKFGSRNPEGSFLFRLKVILGSVSSNYERLHGLCSLRWRLDCQGIF